MHKKSKLSTDDIQTGSGSFSVSDTGEVLYNVNIINLMKLLLCLHKLMKRLQKN